MIVVLYNRFIQLIKHNIVSMTSVCITASLLKEHLCSVRLVTLVRIGVATHTQVQTTK